MAEIVLIVLVPSYAIMLWYFALRFRKTNGAKETAIKEEIKEAVNNLPMSSRGLSEESLSKIRTRLINEYDLETKELEEVMERVKETYE